MFRRSSSCKDVDNDDEQLLWMKLVHVLVFSSRNSTLFKNFLPEIEKTKFRYWHYKQIHDSEEYF